MPFQQAVLHADHLDHAGQPGEAAGQRQRERLVERHRDAGVARGVGIQADRPDAVADGRAPEEDVDDERQEHRDDRAGVQQRLRHQARQPDLFGQPLGLRQERAGLDARRDPSAGRGCSKFINCSAIAFIMTVLRISLTPRRALRMPGMKPQTAPARKPMISVAG